MHPWPARYNSAVNHSVVILRTRIFPVSQPGCDSSEISAGHHHFLFISNLLTDRAKRDWAVLCSNWLLTFVFQADMSGHFQLQERD